MLYAIGFGLLLGLLSLLFGGLKPSSKGVGPTGVFRLGELPQKLLLDELDDGHVFQIVIFRQSGNFDRALYAHSKELALREIEKLFGRMREDSVRIWTNQTTACDLRRPYGSLNGSREGRKIWGCQIEAIPEVAG